MSTAPAPAVTVNKNGQTEMPKNMILDPGWFNGDRTKFEDWWRGMRLFLKSNRVMETNDRIIAITSVGQGYESTEGCHDYKTSTGTTYGGRGQPMDIGKSNNNFKDGKPKCFNCNKYRHMAKECQLEKKERET